MKFEGFGIDTMKKVFDFYLNSKYKGGFNSFQTRQLGTFENVKTQFMTEEQMHQQNIEYVSEVALIYLKTFYGKSPKDFKTPEYKAECIRLRKVIENSQNPALLKKSIEKIIADGKIDYINISQDPLYENVFFSRIKELGLSTDDISPGHKLFITPDYKSVARIYVNPSLPYYKDLVIFLTQKIATEELGVGAKTRMAWVNSPIEKGCDTLIIYISAEDFARVVEILEEFGTLYPEKVATFGPIVECIGKTKQGWFGVGYEPQRHPRAQSGHSTFNTEIEDLFNYFILPATTLNDFGNIITLLTPAEQIEIIRAMCLTDTQAQKVLKALKDPKARAQFLSGFCDLSYVTEFSNNQIKQFAKNPSELNGFSPEMLARFSWQMDIQVVASQPITLTYNGENVLTISRKEFSKKVLLNKTFRLAMLRYYNTQEKIDKEAQEMLTLWKYAGIALPSVDSDKPFLNVDMARSVADYEKRKLLKPKTYRGTISEQMQQILAEQDINPKLDIAHKIDETQKEQIDVIESLCGKTYFLKRKIQQIIQERDLKHVPDYSNFTRDELEKLLIKLVGLDNVINAAMFVKNNTKKGEKIYHKYENTLQGMRNYRGLVILNSLKMMKNKLQRQKYINSLSMYEKEDLVIAASLQGNMDFTNDLIAVAEL